MLIESHKPFPMKFDRVLVPMARGERSGRVLRMAFDLSRTYSSEITAFTVRDERKELTWTNKVNLVTDAYRTGKSSNVKVIPKIVSSGSVREAIVREANSHSYDCLIVATTRRSPLSGAVFGSIGDYIMKHARIPVVIVSLKGSPYPYRSIIAPVSEELSTQASISFALHFKRALGCTLVLPDLRRSDRNPSHGFSMLDEYMPYIESQFGEGISFMNPEYSTGSSEELRNIGAITGSDAAIVGVKTSTSGMIRMSASLKDTIKHYEGDVIAVRKD